VNPWLHVLAVFAVSYMVGSIPFGLLVGRLKGVDVRKLGSGNIGATNVARVLGTEWFPVVLILDGLKGAVPCAIALWALPVENFVWDPVLVAGVGALLGHFFPVYIGFRGGKGVATGLGVVLIVTALPGYGWPIPAVCALGVFLLVLAATRMVSAASIVAAFTLPPWYWLWTHPKTFDDGFLTSRFVFLCVAFAFVVLRHRTNIARILQGTEPRLGKPRTEGT
jgi:acyl phosphate:glycerol-3-phosphate acyltransferase